MVVTNFQQLTSNLGAKVKRVSHGGRSYLVAPASLIMPRVLNGSDGPGYYPPEENTRNVSAWNGIPIVAYHPVTEDGEPTAALNEYGRIDKRVYREVGLGALRNSRGDSGRLIAEAWFDEEHVKNYDAKLFGDSKILPRLNAEKPIELSTGLHVEKDIQNGTCPNTGKPYTWIARNHKPDHLAVLPDQRGACSVEDGCGVVVNSNPEGHNQYTGGFHQTAIDARKASREVYETSSGTKGEEVSAKALAASEATHKSGLGIDIATAHKDASVAHDAARDEHLRLRGTDKGMAEFHGVASREHQAAANAHEKAMNHFNKGRALRYTANAESEGQWITISGTHVLVKDGEIVGGPAALVGKGKKDSGGETHDSFTKKVDDVVKRINAHGQKGSKGSKEESQKLVDETRKLEAEHKAVTAGMSKSELAKAARLSKTGGLTREKLEAIVQKGVRDRMGTALRVYNAEKESEGKWVTLPNGVHIMVKDGEIVHGPKELKSDKKEDFRDKVSDARTTTFDKKDDLGAAAGRAAVKRDLSKDVPKRNPDLLRDRVSDVKNEDATENAGKYGNPQCGDTGHFMPHGSGTGKGEVHGAAKEGRHGPKAVENDCAGGIAENCSMTSRVGNSNPEGCNQYKDCARAALEASKTAAKSGKKEDHEAAVKAHEKAASVALDDNTRLNHWDSASHHEFKAKDIQGARTGSFQDARRQAATRQIKVDEGRIPKRNQQGDKTMAIQPLKAGERTSLLTKLVANCKCSDDDAGVLNTLSDASLLRVANAFPMAKQKEDPEDEEDGGDDEDMEKADGSKKKVPPQFAKNQRAKEITVNAAVENKQMSFEELLQAAPPAYKAVWNTAVKVEQRERKELLNKLIANVEGEKKKEATWNAFKDKPIDELQAIVDLMPVPRPVQNANPFPSFPTFAGAQGHDGGATNNAATGDQDLLDIPTINWAEKAMA